MDVTKFDTEDVITTSLDITPDDNTPPLNPDTWELPVKT